MTARLLCLVFTCFHLINLNDGARILGVFPVPAPSHYILANALMKGLAEAGHDVTIISSFSEKNPPKGGTWREIILDGFLADQEKLNTDRNMFEMEDLSPFLATAYFMNVMGISHTEKTLNHTNVQKLIKSDEKFDIVIVSQFINDAMKAFANHFNGHLVVFSPKKLPDDLKKFLDDAKEGVIYFSMGSNLKSKNLPTEKRDAILKSFGQRKEKVLWKWEEDLLPGQPPNVKLGKWLPQSDILAHPNVKVFITHGGLLSTTETIYRGVPIIAIPVFGDQKMNANTAKEAGYGLVLPYQELSEEKLSSLLNEILTNPKYRENVQQRSRIMADRQVKPLGTAVYWVEYVLRHNGAKHLRVPYLDLTCSNQGARILGVFPVAAPSHYILGSALMKGLAEAGHDITIITPYTEKNPPKRGTWREVFLGDYMAELQREKLLNHTDVQKLIKSDEKFDVVIVSQLFYDVLKAFANHFDAHLVIFSNIAANSMLNHLVGNPSLPSFHPEVPLGFQKHMSFFQRLVNTLAKFVFVLLLNLVFYPTQSQLLQTYFPNPIDLNDVLYNVSLVLLNSHVSISSPQPSVPSMIEIGGFHVTPPKKLPDDLQKFLDEAKEGVIYFSMGSNLKSKYLPQETREAFLKAFGKRKEKVLWKWEDDVLPGQPPNVKLGKWLPQQDILAHPNVKVFITHGGLLSTTETVYHGVPIIAIPIFGDQKMNAITAQDEGYAIVLPFQELSEEKLTSYLNEITINPQYRENVKERSRIMKDRQIKPLDNAVYWVEYVIRHNGAKHLRVPYLDLTWYQYYLLDVLGFIFVVLFALVILLRIIFRYIYCRKVVKTKLKEN
ncbi:hypothetical protein NQ314_018641 [Rhamnusium bicolor]|uniref:UDP-glycosyltransferases domain-containing protein n=1 Tax=Rhamnusium bicolor TaxID=1586634 RepID=A0AAV8WQL5_9CUCU|nr:hypothetical protein NQ314_018641 [Rhamnusium bicolor]